MMTPSQRTQMLSELAALQAGDGSYDDTLPPSRHSTPTSPITIRIGYVTSAGGVRHDGIEILDCPPSVLTRVLQVADAMTPHAVMVDVVNGAVRVS
jgi:hypothetical protein